MARGSGLLKQALAKHGGTKEAFAREVLGRRREVVHRWDTGERAIPSVVLERLRAYLKEAR